MYTPDGNAFNQRGAKSTMEESFMDIVNFVDSHYKTIKKREARAVTGLSMGGGHTFGISRLYPQCSIITACSRLPVVCLVR